MSDTLLQDASVVFGEDVFAVEGEEAGPESPLPALVGTPVAGRRRAGRRTTLSPREFRGAGVTFGPELPETVVLVPSVPGAPIATDHAVIKRPDVWVQDETVFFQPQARKIPPQLLSMSRAGQPDQSVLSKEAQYAYALMTVFETEADRGAMTIPMIQAGRALTRYLMRAYLGTEDLDAGYQNMLDQELAGVQAQYLRLQIENDRAEREARLAAEASAQKDAKVNEYMQGLAQIMREAMEEIACRKIYDAVSKLNRVAVKQVLYDFAAARDIRQPDTVEAQLVLLHLQPSVASQLKELIFDPTRVCPEFDLREFDATRARLKDQISVLADWVKPFDDEASEKIDEWIDKPFEDLPTDVDIFLEAYAPPIYAALVSLYDEVKGGCNLNRYVTLNEILEKDEVRVHYVSLASVLDDAGRDPRISQTRYNIAYRQQQVRHVRMRLAQALYNVRWRSTPRLGPIDTSD